MPDTRTCLKKGTILQLDKDYIIQEEIGRGASCLVYDGYYIDSGKHRVRIKECFPCHIEARRDPEHNIIPAKGCEGLFEAAKSTFSDAYKKNIELRNKEGLINATIDSNWMHRQNNTVYTVMAYIEGTNYGEFTEGCLSDIFMRMKRLCKFLGDYHKNGYLHLDIKPGNILIPSDTKEQVVLFDFDSLIKIEDLRNGGEIRIACSPGFSAPELLQGAPEQIGATADIYSVGAVIFYKIFKKIPGIWDQTWNATYDFSAMAFPDGRYQPKLFPKLTEFFHQTLSAAILRYQTMEEVAAALEELKKLSDLDGVALLNHFSYKFPQFVGRRDELLQIEAELKESDAVFLSGMGGIGKTELAKKFASQYRSRFNRIVFLRFAGTIMDTVCSEELMISKCEAEAQEPLSDFYTRKLKSLRQNASKDDLIILDNFDCREGIDALAEDEHLNDLLNCGCKILITTRENAWTEYAYTQVDIEPLKDSREYRALFQRSNHKEYSPKEWDAIEQLFHLLEGHTMTIALLAKYLLHTEQAPSALLRQMEQKEGITSAKTPPVRDNKDDFRWKQPVYAHLQILFDLSGFSRLERELMGSLSLLGPIRIQKSVFVQYFEPCSDTEAHLANLIQHGWIEEDWETNKISLHQIILDLAYHSLRPTAENCPHITRSMVSYFKTAEPSYIQRQNRKKLAAYFIDRIQGATLLLAELYYAYCCYITEDGQTLAQAKQICRNANSYESRLLAVKLCHLEIASLIQKTDWSEADWTELEYEEQMELSLQDIYQQVFQLEEEIFADLRNAILQQTPIPQQAKKILLPAMPPPNPEAAPDIQEIKKQKAEADNAIRSIFESRIEHGHPLAPYVNDSLVRLYLETADVMETLGNQICDNYMLLDEPALSGLISIYQDAEQIYLYTSKLAEQEFISYQVKEDLYKKMIDFYTEEDFSRFYRCTYVGDQGKSAYYSEKLHEVRAVLTDGKEIFHSSETSYLDAAHQAKWNQRYEDAIALYQKALEKDEWFAEDIQYHISDAYLGLHEYEKAEALLLEALRMEEAKGENTCGTLEKLVELYEQQGMEDKVIAYCNKIICSQANLLEKRDPTAIAQTLIFEMKKAKWEGQGEIQQKDSNYMIWSQYLQMLDAFPEIDPILVPTYIEYAVYCQETGQLEHALPLLFSAAEKYKKMNYDSEASTLYQFIIQDSRFGEIRKDLYLRAILWEAEFLSERQDDAAQALALCSYAERLLKDGCPDFEYIEALLYHTEADIYQYSQTYCNYSLYQSKARQCNYYLLTERKLEEQCSLKDAFNEWKDAANNYIELDNSDMARQCLDRMEQEAEKKAGMPYFLEYYSACFAWIKMDPAQKELPVYTKALYRRLVSYIHCPTETIEDALCLQALETIRDNAFQYEAYDSALYAGLLSVSILSDEGWAGKAELAEELPERDFPKSDTHIWAVLQEDYISKAEHIFPEKAEGKKLDGLIRLIKPMMAGIEGHPEFEKLHAALGIIEERYRTEQIDFKR